MKKTKNLIFLTAIFYILFLSGYSLWTKDGLSSRIPKKYLLEGEYLASQDGFQYYRIDGTEEEVAVSVSSNSQQTTYRIPENVTLEGKTYQVTGIWRSGFAFLTDLDITFPSTLKTIDYEAFFHTGFASNCREISLPYTLEGLGCAAFFNTDIENLVFLDGQASDIGTCPTSEEQPQEEGVTTISHLSSISPFTFARCTKLKTVTFSSSLRTIGEEAFEHCQSLTNLAFLSGLETIKSRAFSCCYSLSQVYLPNALFMKTDEAAIGPFAFAYCNTNLNIQAAYDGEIPDTFGSKNPDWNRINEYKDGTYKVTAVKGDMYIENVWLYQDDGSEVRIRKYLGESKENIAFPETIRNHKVTTIDSDCFSLLTKKKGIKRIFLPKTLTEIPDGLFSSDFTDLIYIGALQGDNCYTIPKEDNIIDLARLSQLETIGEKAFNANRDGFNTLSLPGNLKEIRKQAFQDLKNIRNFSIQPRTDTSSFIIGEKAFFQLGLNAEKPQVDLTLPQETITISANAFANSNCLRSLTIEGNGSIKLDVLDNAFAGCINLDKVTIEERSGKIGIGDNAFGLAYGNSPVDYSYSPNLQFTYLPKNAIVSKSAFSRQLRAVLYFQGDTEYLPDSSFLEQVKDKNSNGIDYLHTTASTLFGFSLIPPVYKNTGLAKTGNGYLIYDQGRNASSNVDDCTYLLYEEDGIKKAILTRYRFNMLDDSDSTALEVTVPQTVDYLGNTYKVTSIGDNAFACSDGYQNGKSRTIRKINLPDTIETIGNYAFFRMAGLEEINMPASLKSVGELAFAFTGIQQIEELNSDTEFLKKDKTSAFSDFRTSSPFLNCPDLRKITLNRKTTTRLRSDSKKLTDANGNILTVYPKYDGTDKDFVSSKFYFGAYKGVTWIQDLTISASDFPTSGASQLPQSLFTGFQSKDDIRKNLTFQGSSATLEALDHLSPLKVLTLKTDKQGNLSFPENSFLNTSISIIRIPYSENGTIPSYFLKGITSSDSKLIFQVQQGKEGTYNNGGDMALTYPSMATYGLLDFGDASGYKTIQKFAFQGISDIKDLILPDTLSSVEDYAFNSCPNLSNVTFKGTDITLGSHSFSQNSNLVSINTIRNGELIENLIDTRSIGFAAFFSDKKLTSIRIGAHVMDFKGTDNRAFKGCDRLSDVGFEETDTPLKLNDWAFQSCFRLTKGTIDFSTRPIVLGTQAFLSCTYLTQVKFASKDASIGKQTFQYCTNLTDVIFSEGVYSIQDQAFDNCGLQTADLSKCTRLEKVTGFSNCSKLSEVIFPSGNNVTEIGSDAFYRCVSLAYIVIPDSVTLIGDRAFQGCIQLTEVTLPSSLSRIGTSLFQDCTSLKRVTLKGNITTIGDSAFYNCTALTTIRSKETDPENTVTLPYTLTSIGVSAFENCISLTSIHLPNSLLTIQDRAFFSAGLTSVTLPPSLTYLGGNCFASCKNLVKAVLNGKNFTLMTGTFKDCPKLEAILINGNDNGQYQDSCFDNLPSLRFVLLPDDFDYSIDTSIFSKCSGLIKGVVLIGNIDTTKGMGKWSYLKDSTTQVRYAYGKEDGKTYGEGMYLWEWNAQNETINLYLYTSNTMTLTETILIPE